MTEQDVAELLALGHELPSVECKAAGPRSDSHLFAKVVRAMLAMSNRRDGGYVLIGVRDTGTTLEAEGVSEQDLASWSHDLIADGLRKYADPGVTFTREVREVSGRTILVLRVESFDEIPTLCGQPYQSGKDAVLRKGALYIRSQTKAESSEVGTYAAMREVIEIATERRLRAFLSTARNAGVDLAASAIQASLAPPTESPGPTADQSFMEEREQPSDVATLGKLKKRAWWEVVVRPADYAKARVGKLSDLKEIVQRCTVQLRGWDFPHAPHRNATPGINWVESSYDMDQYLGWWRLFQSGQLYSCTAVQGEWRDQSTFWAPGPDWKAGRHLGIAGTLFFFVEIFEFAARLAGQLSGDDPFSVEVTAHRTKGLALLVDDPGRYPFLSDSYAASADDIPFSLTLSRAELLAAPRDRALDAAAWVFERFDWSPSLDVLRSWQAKLPSSR